MAGGAGLTRDAVALTQRAIDALRPAQTAYRVLDQRCIGLAIRVAPSGIKTWDLPFRIKGAGKVRRLSLRRLADVSLEQARDRANALTSAARTGRDLLAEGAEAKATAATRVTVEGLIAVYVRRRTGGRRQRPDLSSSSPSRTPWIQDSRGPTAPICIGRNAQRCSSTCTRAIRSGMWALTRRRGDAIAFAILVRNVMGAPL